MRAIYRFFPPLIIVIFLACLFPGGRAHAVFMEKKFVVKHDMGKDILCDDYVVKKNDYVTLILKQRGEIAYKDFPMFLKIFKHLNPQIKDVNLIYPHQHLIIPLKILTPNSVEGQASGTVTIPVITITNLPERLRQNAQPYTIKYGDWISKLISKRFGPYNSKAYKEGLRLFSKLNPDISDINFVRAGQKVFLPDPSMLKKIQYSEKTTVSAKIPENRAQVTRMPRRKTSRQKPKTVQADVLKKTVKPVIKELKPALQPMPLTPIPASRPIKTVKSGQRHAVSPIVSENEKQIPRLAEIKPPSKPAPVLPVKKARGFADKSSLEKAAKILGARLLTTGKYFLPRSSESDFVLDLSIMPMMEFDSGRRLIFTKKGWLSIDDAHVITSNWKKAKIITIRPDISLDGVLNEIITATAKDGYTTRQSFIDGNISVDVRANYIFTLPGTSKTICLNLINRPEMKSDEAFRRYLSSKGFIVSDWIESPSFSGWVQETKTPEELHADFDTIQPGDVQAFVRAVCKTLGWRYRNKVEVSFPYAGFQVKAVMDMISFSPGDDMLLDYGNLGGDAVSAIRDTGFHIVQIGKDNGDGKNPDASFIDMLSAEGRVDASKNPLFWTADKPRLYNPSFQVTGELIKAKKGTEKKILWVPAPIPDDLVLFLKNRNIRVLVSR